MTSDRDLFLHEIIDINGLHQWDYMEHCRQQSGDEKVDFELLGTWYTMGITARWPQVVNVWEIPGGWDGWYGKVDRLGLSASQRARSTRGRSRRTNTGRVASTACSAPLRAARTSRRVAANRGPLACTEQATATGYPGRTSEPSAGSACRSSRTTTITSSVATR